MKVKVGTYMTSIRLVSAVHTHVNKEFVSGVESTSFPCTIPPQTTEFIAYNQKANYYKIYFCQLENEVIDFSI